MTGVEHYTTLTVEEYSHMANTILALREKIQKARQFLENRRIEEALNLLKVELE